MRILCALFASLLVTPILGCTTVDPDECWVNTSGGFGGGGTFPTGAGVGATSSGDFITPPPRGPLAADGTANPCMAGRIVSFSPAEFPFVTIVPDDGKGPGGGYQEANPNLSFYDVRNTSAKQWSCTFVIGMPLRTAGMGQVSASRAANLSVEITEWVANDPKTDYTMPPGIFCTEFIRNVDVAFKARYPLLGSSTVKK